jgi:hypothetical protein
MGESFSGVRRENSEPVPNEPTTPSKPRYVPVSIHDCFYIIAGSNASFFFAEEDR